MNQLWSFWCQVNSVLVGPWLSLTHQEYKYKWQHYYVFCKCINLPQLCGLFFIGVVCCLLFLGGWPALKGTPLWKPFLQFKSILFWWSNCEAFDSKTILFWLVHGWVWRIKSISTSGNTILLLQMYAVGPIFYWGGFSLTLSWGVICSEGHTPLKTIFTIENRYFFDEAIVKLLIPSQFCFGWSMVESGASRV